MGKYTDSNTFAEESGNLSISKQMLKHACPDMFGKFGIKFKYSRAYKQMCEFISFGDTQPAIIYSLSPFLIAAYSDEMDAVVMIHFDESLVNKYNIHKGQHMISINVYEDGKTLGIDIPEDITIGPNYLNRWTDFSPHIADLLSDESEIIEQHKMNISNDKWSYVKQLAEEYAMSKPGIYRDGKKGLVTPR